MVIPYISEHPLKDFELTAGAHFDHAIFFRDVGWMMWAFAVMGLVLWSFICLRIDKKGIGYSFTWGNNLAGILFLWPFLGMIFTRLTDVLFTQIGITLFPYGELHTLLDRMVPLIVAGVPMQGLWNWGTGADRNKRAMYGGLFLVVVWFVYVAFADSSEVVPHLYGATKDQIQTFRIAYSVALGSKEMADMVMNDVSNGRVGWAHAIPLIMLSLVAMAPMASRMRSQIVKKNWLYGIVTPLMAGLFLLTLLGNIVFHSRIVAPFAAIVGAVLLGTLLVRQWIKEKRLGMIVVSLSAILIYYFGIDDGITHLFAYRIWLTAAAVLALGAWLVFDHTRAKKKN